MASNGGETGAFEADRGRAARIAALRARGLEAALASYDPERHLIAQASPAGRTYRQASSLPLAQALLERGDPEGAREAARIVKAVLASQAVDAEHPHAGNWLWLADDPEVVDPNAVQFVLRGLLPILVGHAHRLPAPLVERCRRRVRLALAEEERLDVAPSYTNIHLMSLFALVVGGEWLGDNRYRALGVERWDRWVAFTVASGAPYEYNTPAMAPSTWPAWRRWHP